MSRIGLTQRVEEVKAYDERRDCLDQRWAPLLDNLALTPVPLSNRISDVETYVRKLTLDGIIFTGGNDFADLESGTNIAPERDRFEHAVLETAIEQEIPLLGVCRGLQLINRYFGGSIRSIDAHVAVEHPIQIDHAAAPIELTEQDVVTNSYHGYGIADGDLAENVTAVAHTADGSIEWIEHEQHPITGIMWHPEREPAVTELDRRIIQHRLPTDEA